MIKEMKKYIKVEKLNFSEPINIDEGTKIRKDSYDGSKIVRIRNFQLPSGYAIYVYFNSNMEVMYIGKTNNLKRRYNEHQNETSSKVYKSKQINNENIKFYSYALCKTKEEVEVMEMIYIHLLKPKLNNISLKEVELIS